MKTWSEVDFGLMLKAAAKVKKDNPLWREGVNNPINIPSYLIYHSYTPKALRYKYQKAILRRYFLLQPVPEGHLKANKVVYARAACASFRKVFGHTFTSASKLIKGKAWGCLSDNDKILANYHLYARKAFVALHCRSIDPPTMEQLKQENETLLWASLCYMSKVESTNAFKNLKHCLKSDGLTNKGWKFLCKQSRNWVLGAASFTSRRIFVVCCNHGIRYSLMRNPFFRLMIKSGMYRYDQVFRIFLKDLGKTPMCKWEPFPVRRFRQVTGNSCTQLLEIRDYIGSLVRHVEGRQILLNFEVTTLAGLYRRTQRWHEEIHNKRNKDRPYIEFYKPSWLIDETTIEGVHFQWLSDTKELSKEGSKMHHCVHMYDKRCGEGRYGVWHVTGPDGEEATLGVDLSSSFVRVDQVSSYCNGLVSDHLREMAEQFVKQLGRGETYESSLLRPRRYTGEDQPQVAPCTEEAPGLECF